MCAVFSTTVGAAVIWAVPAKAETPLFGVIPMTSLSSPAGATAKQTGDIKHADACGDIHLVDAWGQCIGFIQFGGGTGPAGLQHLNGPPSQITSNTPPAKSPPSDDGCGDKGEGKHGRGGDQASRGEGRGHGHGGHGHSPS